MKKYRLLTILILISTFGTFAQVNNQNSYCGNSGPGACVSTPLSSPGLSPQSDSLTPFIDGQPTSTNIIFQNFDVIQFQGNNLTMDSLTVVSIENLPEGLCWRTNISNNTFQNQQNGCIIVSGTTHAQPGQYKLTIMVTAATSLGTPLTVSAAAAGLYYYVRVNCSDSAYVRPIDTTGQAEGTLPFVAYNETSCNTAINYIDGNFTSLDIFPNPSNSKTKAKFYINQESSVIETLTNVVGEQVLKSQFNAKAGTNVRSLKVANIEPGIYFYTISDGTSSITTKLLITTE